MINMRGGRLGDPQTPQGLLWRAKAGWFENVIGKGLRFLFTVCFFLEATGLGALAAVQNPAIAITKMEFQSGTGQDSFSLITEGKVSYKIFPVSSPSRLVIDIDNATYAAQKTLAPNSARVQRIRAGQWQDKPTMIVRVVIDLKGQIAASATATDKRLVVLLTDATKTLPKRDGGPKASAPAKKAATPEAPKETTPQVPKTEIAESSTPGTEDPAQNPSEPIEGNPAPVSKAAPAAKAPVETPPADETTSRPPPPDEAETPSKRMDLPKTILSGISFAEGTDIQEVLAFFQDYSGMNIIYGKEVTGPVPAVRLVDVPFDEALDHILGLTGYVKSQISKNVIKIYTPGTFLAERNQAVPITVSYSLEYADATSVAGQISALLAAEGLRVTISQDTRLNALNISSTSEGHARIEQILENVDKSPQQVYIEAKIVEIVLVNNWDVGIEWAIAGRKGIIRDSATTPKHALGKATAGQIGSKPGDTQDIPVTFTSGGSGATFPAVSSLAGFNYGYVSDNTSFNMRLGTLLEKTKSKVLSQPRIATINGKVATITVGDSIPFLQTTVTTAGSTQSTSFIQTGIVLTVTPIIRAGGRIELTVAPSVSFLRAFLAAGPQISQRAAQTTILVKDGQTIVIGGLISENDRKAVSQIPLLGDLPIFGHLFKNINNDKDRSELLVFMTPTIIRE